MIMNIKKSDRFIELLQFGKFRKPEHIKLQQLCRKEYDEIEMIKELENFKYFLNTSCYDEIEKVKVKKYVGDNF